MFWACPLRFAATLLRWGRDFRSKVRQPREAHPLRAFHCNPSRSSGVTGNVDISKQFL